MSLKNSEVKELQEYLNTTVTSIDGLYHRFLKELMSENAWQHYKIYNHRRFNPLYRWRQTELAQIRHAQLGKGVATVPQTQTYSKSRENLRKNISSDHAISKTFKEDVLRAYLTAVRQHNAPKVPRGRTSLQEYLNTNKTSFDDLYKRFANELIAKASTNNGNTSNKGLHNWNKKGRQRIISAAHGNATAETYKFQATNGNATYQKLRDVIAATVDPKKKAAVLRAYTLAVERDEAPHLMRAYNYYELSPKETSNIQKYLNTSKKSVNDLYNEFQNKVVDNWLETWSSNALSPNALGRVLNAKARSNVQARIMVGKAQQGTNASKFPGLLEYPRSQLIVAIRDPQKMLNQTPPLKRTQIKTAVLQAYMKAAEENMAPKARKNKTRNMA